MAEQTKKENKLSYDELVNVARQLQERVNEQERVLNRVNEFREMTALCVELLKYVEILRPETKEKVLDFIDKVVPVPKETQEEA